MTVMKPIETHEPSSPSSPNAQSNIAISGYLQSLPLPKKQIRKTNAPLPQFRCDRPRLLWIGDALVPTGFATVTHSIVGHLCNEWNVLVSGVNCEQPSDALPYPVIPACQMDDMWGIDNFANLVAEFEPDVVVINNDWWNVARFLECHVDVPIVAYMPVDGANLDPDDVQSLNRLSAAIWYTEFGYAEARSSGFSGPRHVIPHGVDTATATAFSKREARKMLDLSLPNDAFLIGNVNRNQPRKRLDLTVDYFASWIHEKRIDNAWLYLHCSHSNEGWDLKRLADYRGVASRVILSDGSGTIGSVSKSALQLIYQAMDLQVTTTSGEGWGLTTMEGMSHGVPQIVPDWAALGEWTGEGVERINCSTQLSHPGINTIGAIPDRLPFVNAIDRMYRSAELKTTSSDAARDWVNQAQFRWTNIADQFEQILRSATASKRMPRTFRKAG